MHPGPSPMGRSRPSVNGMPTTGSRALRTLVCRRCAMRSETEDSSTSTDTRSTCGTERRATQYPFLDGPRRTSADTCLCVSRNPNAERAPNYRTRVLCPTITCWTSFSSCSVGLDTRTVWYCRSTLSSAEHTTQYGDTFATRSDGYFCE